MPIKTSEHAHAVLEEKVQSVKMCLPFNLNNKYGTVTPKPPLTDEAERFIDTDKMMKCAVVLDLGTPLRCGELPEGNPDPLMNLWRVRNKETEGVGGQRT